MVFWVASMKSRHGMSALFARFFGLLSKTRFYRSDRGTRGARRSLAFCEASKSRGRTPVNKSKVAAHCLGHLSSMLGMVITKTVDNLLGLVNVLLQVAFAICNWIGVRCTTVCQSKGR